MGDFLAGCDTFTQGENFCGFYVDAEDKVEGKDGEDVEPVEAEEVFQEFGAVPFEGEVDREEGDDNRICDSRPGFVCVEVGRKLERDEHSEKEDEDGDCAVDEVFDGEEVWRKMAFVVVACR